MEPLNISNILGEKFKLNNSNDERLIDEFKVIKNKYKQNNQIKYEPGININNDCNTLNNIFNLFELNNNVNHNKSKSCGPDYIPFVLIQNLPFKSIEIFLKYITNYGYKVPSLITGNR